MSDHILIFKTCSCVSSSRHSCKRNFGTQFPEVPGILYLRGIDLIPVPKPKVLVPVVSKLEKSTQVDQTLLELEYYPSAATSVQGSSLFEEDLRSVITAHLTVKSPHRVRKTIYPAGWPKEEEEEVGKPQSS